MVLKVDGRKLSRRRGSTNSFVLDGQKFVALKRGVPDAIANLLNVGDVNFQAQHDPAFYLSDSPPVVARQLNQIVNLERIDTALANVGRAVRRAIASVCLTRERLLAARSARLQLGWVPNYLDKLDKLERLEAEEAARSVRIDALREILESVESLDRRAAAVSGRILAVSAVVDAGARIVRLGNRIDGVRNVLDGLRRISKAEAESMQRIAILEHRIEEVRTCPACGKPIR